MRFALMTEPQQGLTYAEQLAVVQRAEAVGFESFFRSDHYQSFPGPSGAPTTDAWAVLAGLARETTRIGLGVAVTNPVTRHPAATAAAIASVHVESGGRAVLGIGRGDSALAHIGLSPAPVPVFAAYLRRLQGYLRRDEVPFPDCCWAPNLVFQRTRRQMLRKLVHAIGVSGFVVNVRPRNSKGLVGRAAKDQRVGGGEFLVLDPIPFRASTEWSCPVAKT